VQTVEKIVTLPLDLVFYVLAGIESILAELLLSAGRPTPSQCAVCAEDVLLMTCMRTSLASADLFCGPVQPLQARRLHHTSQIHHLPVHVP
jgi:hypothetical protein